VTTTVLTISGMTCEHCVRAVQAGLAAVAGVTSVAAEIGRAVVISDQPLDDATIRATIEDEGYELVACATESPPRSR
jgi:copper chaperone